MRHTTIDEITAWMHNLKSLVETKNCAAPEFLRPFHLISLALTLKAHGAAAVALPDSLHGYAARLHLWEAIGINPPRLKRELDASGRFLPIEALRSRAHVEECSERVAQIAVNAKMPEASRNSLCTALSELMDNCFSHSGVNDRLQGLACAQYWPKGKLLQVAIADMGVGIRRTFEQADSQEFRERVAASNCCSLATELGASSKLFSGHAGYGLALARQLAEQNNGTMAVYSGDEWCHTSRNISSEGKYDLPWNGTIVVVEFNTEMQLSTQQVYQNWPPVRGYTDDDFNF